MAKSNKKTLDTDSVELADAPAVETPVEVVPAPEKDESLLDELLDAAGDVIEKAAEVAIDAAKEIVVGAVWKLFNQHGIERTGDCPDTFERLKKLGWRE